VLARDGAIQTARVDAGVLRTELIADLNAFTPPGRGRAD
jgi:hypothetical protein